MHPVSTFLHFHIYNSLSTHESYASCFYISTFPHLQFPIYSRIICILFLHFYISTSTIPYLLTSHMHPVSTFLHFHIYNSLSTHESYAYCFYISTFPHLQFPIYSRVICILFLHFYISTSIIPYLLTSHMHPVSTFLHFHIYNSLSTHESYASCFYISTFPHL